MQHRFPSPSTPTRCQTLRILFPMMKRRSNGSSISHSSFPCQRTLFIEYYYSHRLDMQHRLIEAKFGYTLSPRIKIGDGDVVLDNGCGTGERRTSLASVRVQLRPKTYQYDRRVQEHGISPSTLTWLRAHPRSSSYTPISATTASPHPPPSPPTSNSKPTIYGRASSESSTNGS